MYASFRYTRDIATCAFSCIFVRNSGPGSRLLARREVRRVPIGTLPGRGRIWGSTTLRYWASLDPGRPGKKTALILDTGHHILPLITPDDPSAVAAAPHDMNLGFQCVRAT